MTFGGAWHEILHSGLPVIVGMLIGWTGGAVYRRYQQRKDLDTVVKGWRITDGPTGRTRGDGGGRG